MNARRERQVGHVPEMWAQRRFRFAVESKVAGNQQASRSWLGKAILNPEAAFQTMMLRCRLSPQQVDRRSWLRHRGNVPRDLAPAIQIGIGHEVLRPRIIVHRRDTSDVSGGPVYGTLSLGPGCARVFRLQAADAPHWAGRRYSSMPVYDSAINVPGKLMFGFLAGGDSKRPGSGLALRGSRSITPAHCGSRANHR